MSTARRGKGEGTISERPDGTWWARIDLGYQDGKRVRKALYGPTRAAVAEKMTAALRDQHLNLPIVVRDQTVRAFLTAWLEAVAKPHVRATTFRSYGQMVNGHLIPGLGHHRLQKLAPQHVQAWMADKVEKGASPQLVGYARNVLRIAMRQALEWGLVARNVATLVRPPRGVKRPIVPLTPEQAQTFLASTRSHRLSALFSVGVALGAPGRRGAGAQVAGRRS